MADWQYLIDQAVLIERERCAKIVENHPGTVAYNHKDAEALGMFAREANRHDFAAAIRKDHNGKR